MENIIRDNKGTYCRMDLYRAWRLSSEKKTSDKTKDLEAALLASFHEEQLRKNQDILKNIRRFCSTLSKKWNDSNRTEARFLKNNESWLKGGVSFFHEEEIPQPSSSSVGRPPVSFEESSERTKRRKIKEITEKSTPAELFNAAKYQLRSQGKHDAAKLLSEAVETTPTRASKIRKAWSLSKNKPVDYTPEEALSLLIEAKLTKAQYSKIRLQAKERNANIYPSYTKIRAAKEKCYPPAQYIAISSLVAEITLQALLDHTVSRIILAQEDVIENVLSENIAKMTLICKWGCDGSTGHSEYKQALPEGCTDSDIFITSLVPLQLFSIKEDESKIIIWQNPRPSSVRYCRPISIQYKKETTNLSQETIRNVEEQINNLIPFQTRIEEKNISVKFEMILTMVDGKICNASTSTSSAQTCYVCKATPTEMNKLNLVIAKEVNRDTFRFGLSTLHAWIRFFECFLHISYRLDFKKWQARGENLQQLKNKKLEIQTKFRQELGLLVDKVKPGGSGTSNDGNTARKFFKYPETAAQITGLDINLLKRCGTILQAISSGYDINIEKFDKFAKETAQLFVEKYPWYYMPVSMHKILIHGSAIIGSAVLPIGQLSEEAQECRNKDLKMYRRGHTRKMSRETTNEDLLRCLLVSSDPYITSLRILSAKRSTPLPQEVLELLSEPTIHIETPDEVPRDIQKTSTSEDTSDSHDDTDYEW